MNKPDITPHVIREGYDGKHCLVHARCCPIGNSGHMVAGAQPLNVEGMDSFSELMVSESFDYGKTFTPFRHQDGWKGCFTDGDIMHVACDMTPFYHEKSGKVIFIGSAAAYGRDSILPLPGGGRVTYAVFSPETHLLSDLRMVGMEKSSFINGRCGSGQCLVLPSGNLLIPVAGEEPRKNGRYESGVIECGFDGETLIFLQEGNVLKGPADEPRGIYEPSVAEFGGTCLMSLRSDLRGYVSKSPDGLHFSCPEPWYFTDGEEVPTYNTQSHFFRFQGGLWLAYTRKAGTNDHVFRHRAPLFAAEIDLETLRLKKETEQIVVPERGARLGNFCAGNFDDSHAFVMAAEWMQPLGCERYGSNNAVWFTDIR